MELEMLILDKIKEDTESIFNQAIKVPEPPLIWRDKMEALASANLINQRASLIFDMRKWQAKELGFVELQSSEMVEMIMGEPFTESEDGKVRQNHEWLYNHHTDELLGNTWGGFPTIFRHKEKMNFWHLPPFAIKTKWEVQFGKLDYLKREIPYGVVLRIEEIKKLKLFNAFNVMAPMEAWERKTDIDPIVVASIWEFPLNEEKLYKIAGQSAHYFLAQW
jgi:hypothetical protein